MLEYGLVTWEAFLQFFGFLKVLYVLKWYELYMSWKIKLEVENNQNHVFDKLEYRLIDVFVAFFHWIMRMRVFLGLILFKWCLSLKKHRTGNLF